MDAMQAHNPQESVLDQPLNLVANLKSAIVDHALRDDPSLLPNAEEPPLWNYETVTER